MHDLNNSGIFFLVYYWYNRRKLHNIQYAYVKLNVLRELKCYCGVHQSDVHNALVKNMMSVTAKRLCPSITTTFGDVFVNVRHCLYMYNIFDYALLLSAQHSDVTRLLCQRCSQTASQPRYLNL